MAIASLVLGIITICVSFIPCVNWFALLPGIVGIILGAIGWQANKKANLPVGCAIAGLVLNVIACAWIFVFSLLIVGVAAAGADAAGAPMMFP